MVVKQEQSRKTDCRFKDEPLVITQQKGTMVTAASDKRKITRNVSHFQKCTPGLKEALEQDGDIPDTQGPSQVATIQRLDQQTEAELDAGGMSLRPRRNIHRPKRLIEELE